MRQKYPQVLSEARGKGLLLGLEFPSDSIGYRFAAGLFKRGVVVAGTYSKARTVRIEPALGIPNALLLDVLNRIEDTLREIASSMRVPDRAAAMMA
jgi:putrescine aminotransferase